MVDFLLGFLVGALIVGALIAWHLRRVIVNRTDLMNVARRESCGAQRQLERFLVAVREDVGCARYSRIMNQATGGES